MLLGKLGKKIKEQRSNESKKKSSNDSICETLRAGTGSKEPGINLDHISSASSFNQYQDYQDLNYESKFNGFYSRDNLP